MSIEELYEVFQQYPIICTDTRKISEGCIFFALKGENFNGNKFAAKAIELGASFAIIDEKEFLDSDAHILVNDVLEALQQLATYHRKQLSIPIIGITGSNGKTTTKELTHSVLSQKLNCYATKGNLNNHIGVPLSVLEINHAHDIAIIEMGANHIGEIGFLCNISQPTIGLITNIGKAHLEGFGSLEGVKKAKSELYRYLSDHDAPIFINGDNKTLSELAEGIVQVSYGANEKNQVIGKFEVNQEKLIISWKKRNFISFHEPIKTNLVGSYNFENILAAICIGDHFEISLKEIKNGIECYLPSNNRSQLIQKDSNQIILDAYNANPISVNAAMNNMIESCHENKLLILGDMKELGEYSKNEHQKVVDKLMDNSLCAILVGLEFSNTNHDTLKTFPSTEELIKHLQTNKVLDSLILIKGSRSIGLERVVDFL